MAPLPSYGIVLSTYNGAEFLAEQIESIRAQTSPAWRLYIRDDGSGDETLAVIANCAARDSRISVLADPGGNLGAPASFGLLLSHALARGESFVFLSDQDDVWLPSKAERMLTAAVEQEGQTGPHVPLLVHSDLRVVSPQLNLVHRSYLRLQQLDPHEDAQPARLLFRNAVTGCATLVNRALLGRALPFPHVAMHDWWLAQCAAVFGRIAFVDEATVLYRQHDANVLGARGLVGTAMRSLAAPRRGTRYFLAALEQISELRRRAAEKDAPPPAALQRLLDDLHATLTSDRTTAAQRLRTIWNAKAQPRSLAAQAQLVARIVLLPWLRTWWGTPAPTRDVGPPQVV